MEPLLAAARGTLVSKAAGQLWELAVAQLYKPSKAGEVFLHLGGNPVRVPQKAMVEYKSQ